MHKEYFNYIVLGIKNLENTQLENIDKAAEFVGQTIINGKHVFTFGSGHSQLVAREVVERAGGLVPVYHLPDPIWGMAEQIEGYGKRLISQYPIKADDLIIVISNSGRNPEPIEVAQEAKEIGLKVIVITSLQHSKAVKSRHSSGKLLFEFGDVVIDNGVPKGDAVVSFKGISTKAGALSTIMGTSIMNAIMVEAIQYLLDRDYSPPILLSFNVDGSEEHNNEMMSRYKEMKWAPRYFF